MDWKAEIGKLVSELKSQNAAQVGDVYAHAFSMVAAVLSDLLARAETAASEQQPGYDVWVQEAGAWKKTAWFDKYPSLLTLDQYNADRFRDMSFIREHDKHDYIASTGGQEVRRYRVQPAGKLAPVDEAAGT